jgi:RNA polymerase sigma-70 factor (ECF subfamily)
MDGQQLLAELPRLRRYARALVGDRAAADDLVQDTLERAWQKASAWQAGTNLRAWLLAIMHNLRVDQVRRTPPPATAIEDSPDIAVRPTQADRLELVELGAALSELPEEQRAVLLLVSIEDMSYAEAAATLAVPIGTIMSRLARGRDRLRQILDGRSQPNRLRIVP